MDIKKVSKMVDDNQSTAHSLIYFKSPHRSLIDFKNSKWLTNFTSIYELVVSRIWSGLTYLMSRD